MPISDLCAKNLISLEPSASLQFAAQLMKKNNIGGIVVLESNGKDKPVGILTDRDIVLSVVAENLPLTTKVEQVMSKNIIKVNESEGIATVIDKMANEGVRRMIIVNDAGTARGIVTSDDILQLMARELSSLGRLVGNQVKGEKPFDNKKSQLTL